MAVQNTRTGASPSRLRGASAAVTVLLAALLTCRVRCAETIDKTSNIVLIVTDDQDVLLGGLVSGQREKKVFNRLELFLPHKPLNTIVEKV